MIEWGISFVIIAKEVISMYDRNHVILPSNVPQMAAIAVRDPDMIGGFQGGKIYNQVWQAIALHTTMR